MAVRASFVPPFLYTMKSLKIYSIHNCMSCSNYHRLVDHFCNIHNIAYSIVDVDNEANFPAMIELRLQHIPSTCLYIDGVHVRTLGGVANHDRLFDFVYEH